MPRQKSSATAAGALGSFRSRGEHRFKMRLLLLSCDHVYFDFLETGFLQPAMQVTFGESQPAIAVKFMGAHKIVFGKIQDEDLASMFQNAKPPGNRFRGFLSMMQCLAQNH